MPNFNHRDKDHEIWVNVSNHTIIRVLIAIAVALIGLIALRRAGHALLLIFTAFFLALALNAPVLWMARHLPGKRRGSRAIATTASFLAVIIVIAGFLLVVTPPLVRNTTSFVENVPHLVQETKNKNSPLGRFIHKYNLEPKIDSVSRQLSKQLGRAPGTAVSAVGRVASSIVSILVILVLTFMMLVEGPYWVKRIGNLVPHEHNRHVNRLATDMYKVIRGYVNGQVLLAGIATALITPALFILHVSYPLALMVVVFGCGLIPLFGHTIAAIIIATVALFHSPWSALIILIYYILYMQLENYIIQPRIQSSTTNLSPLLVFLAVVLGIEFGGLFGGLVAIPLMGCLRVLVVDYLHSHGKLESVDPTQEPTAPDIKNV